MAYDGAEISAANCIFRGASSNHVSKRNQSPDPAVTYSCIEGGYSGAGNIDADPLFVDAGGGDYRLGPGSPCIDAGDGDAAPATDILANPRYDDPGVGDTGVGVPTYVDMGAYERQAPTDVDPPTAPQVASADPAVPTVATPYEQLSTSDTTIDITWIPADDGSGTGVAGYSWSFDKVADKVLDRVVDGTSLPAEFTATEDGIWFLHAAAVDNAGNWSETVHCGPWVIDTTDRTYLIIDVSAGPSATNYPVTYQADAPDLSDPAYKATHIVLRRIPAGTFTMGSPEGELGHEPDPREAQHQVTLTQDHYMAVFELTQKQYELVTAATPSEYPGDGRPVENVSYNDMRGSSAGANWPADNSVDSTSFLGRLRAKSGADFDLPTEAQWEYACRAGTTRAYNDYSKNGGAGSDCLTTEKERDTNLDPLARYRYNGEDAGLQDAEVGSYQANAWGLYDMHGNVWEYCLDWYATDPGGDATDPGGPTGPMDPGNPDRCVRGGYWSYHSRLCRSAFRGGGQPVGRFHGGGFRLCLPGVSAPPEPVVDVAATGIGSPLTIDVLDNDTDPDGDALTVVSVTDGAGGTVVNNGDGTVLYTPGPGYSGDDTFTYTVSDGTTLVSGTVTVNVIVNPYLAIDVSGGPSATHYPVTFLQSAPTDLLTSDHWRTDTILLRRIRKGTFTMGSPVDETGRYDREDQHDVTLTQDYYMAVFEVTQEQYERVTGADPSQYKGDKRPVETVSWNTVRGGDWPASAQVASSGKPASTSFVGLLRDKAALALDLPTEAQWEHACRAGTTRAYNDYTRNSGEGSDCLTTGDGQDTNLDPLARYRYNGYGAGDRHADVGTYQANSWGLFDMHVSRLP